MSDAFFPTITGLPGPGSTVDWELTVELDGTPSVAELDLLRSLLQRFWTLVRFGAFVSPDHHPADVSAQARELSPPARPGARWAVRTINIDPRFVQVLRNACVGFSLTYCEISSLTMAVAAAAASPTVPAAQTLPPLASRWADNAGRYPPRIAPLPFDVVSDLRTPDSSRRYEIVHAAVLTDEQAREVIAALDAWGEIGIGGFAETEDELIDGSCVLVNAGAQRLDDYTIELAVEQFGGGVPARDALMNVLCCTDRTVARIRQVAEEQ